MEQFSFSLNMSANSFTYLNPAKHILIYFSNSITLIKSYAIQETDRTIYSINAFNNEMIIIFSQFTALFITMQALPSAETGVILLNLIKAILELKAMIILHAKFRAQTAA